MWMSGRYRMEAVISKHLKVGDLARQTGKSVRALRLYEELDLLPGCAQQRGIPAVRRVRHHANPVDRAPPRNGAFASPDSGPSRGLARKQVRPRGDGGRA